MRMHSGVLAFPRHVVRTPGRPRWGRLCGSSLVLELHGDLSSCSPSPQSPNLRETATGRSGTTASHPGWAAISWAAGEKTARERKRDNSATRNTSRCKTRAIQPKKSPPDAHRLKRQQETVAPIESWPAPSAVRWPLCLFLFSCPYPPCLVALSFVDSLLCPRPVVLCGDFLPILRPTCNGQHGRCTNSVFSGGRCLKRRDRDCTAGFILFSSVVRWQALGQFLHSNVFPSSRYFTNICIISSSFLSLFPYFLSYFLSVFYFILFYFGLYSPSIFRFFCSFSFLFEALHSRILSP